MSAVLACLRVIAVIAVLAAAAVLATPKGRLPLALRGLKRTLRKDLSLPLDATPPATVSASRKFLAFLLVILAVLLALSL